MSNIILQDFHLEFSLNINKTLIDKEKTIFQSEIIHHHEVPQTNNHKIQNAHFDGAMIGSYIASGLGKFISNSSIRSVSEAKEVSQKQMQVMLDVLCDNPETLKRYVGSAWSPTLEANIKSLRSNKHIMTDKVNIPDTISSIANNRKAEFEEQYVQRAKSDNRTISNNDFKTYKQYCEEQFNKRKNITGIK